MTSVFQVIVVVDFDADQRVDPREVWDLMTKPHVLCVSLEDAKKLCQDYATAWATECYNLEEDALEEGHPEMVDSDVTWSQPGPRRWEGRLDDFEANEWSAFIYESELLGTEEKVEEVAVIKDEDTPKVSSSPVQPLATLIVAAVRAARLTKNRKEEQGYWKSVLQELANLLPYQNKPPIIRPDFGMVGNVIINATYVSPANKMTAVRFSVGINYQHQPYHTLINPDDLGIWKDVVNAEWTDALTARYDSRDFYDPDRVPR